MMTEEELVRYIDQTNLKPEVTEAEMREFVEEAKRYLFYGVAILPRWIPLAAKILQGSSTRIVGCISFPLGALPTELKVDETRWALENGPTDIEIDMVMNLAELKSGKYGAVRKDIAEVVRAARGRTVKVIIEAPLLTRDEVVIASLISEMAGAQFVKTSTGFKGFKGWRPTTVEDVRLIKSAVGERMRIKAAGGIRTVHQALELIEAGASRIGTSSGVDMVKELRLASLEPK